MKLLVHYVTISLRRIPPHLTIAEMDQCYLHQQQQHYHYPNAIKWLPPKVEFEGWMLATLNL